MASDTWSDNGPSARAHEALGFEIVDPLHQLPEGAGSAAGHGKGRERRR